MDYTTEKTTKFLEKLWYQYGCTVIDKICAEYNVSEEIRIVLYEKYMRPNDWSLQIK